MNNELNKPFLEKPFTGTGYWMCVLKDLTSPGGEPEHDAHVAKRKTIHRNELLAVHHQGSAKTVERNDV